MNFSWRPTRVSDLEACFPLIPDQSFYDAASRKGLLALWRHLVETDACVSAVIEDLDRPKRDRVMGFGMSCFVTENFAQEIKTTLPPFLPMHLMERWRRGPCPFVYKQEAQDACHSEGLSSVSLHFGWDRSRYGPEHTYQLPVAFTAIHQKHGYWIKEVINEVYGEEGRDFLAKMGFRVLRDYKDYLGTGHVRPFTAESHPFLFLCAKSDVHPSMHIYPLFAKPPVPRIHFKPAEQAILSLALDGKSDNGMAKILDLSPWTIKKRWQRIYVKVEEADPELLGLQTPGGGISRGNKRRRLLVDYLRNHPEELRPGIGPKRGRKPGFERK